MNYQLGSHAQVVSSQRYAVKLRLILTRGWTEYCIKTNSDIIDFQSVVKDTIFVYYETERFPTNEVELRYIHMHVSMQFSLM